jgi:subtilisin family serine protease
VAIGLAPLYGDVSNPDTILGQYMVIYHNNTADTEVQRHWDLVKALGVDVLHYFPLTKGFAARLSEDIVTLLRQDPMVSYIEMDVMAHAFCDEIQKPAPSWGIARVSKLGSVAAGLPLEYAHTTTDGSGVVIYIADTGIFCNHPDLRGRCTWGRTFTGDGDQDINGHGTHCAGTAAGSSLGISKQATLKAVKVLDNSGSGSYSGIVAGIDWIVSDCTGKCIISMSLGGPGPSPTLEQAMERASATIFISVAAGNSNTNACNSIPAGYNFVCTVGATDSTDKRSSFSNIGTCVDIFAPGTAITSAWPDGSTRELSGTSMACPHVTGQAANIWSRENHAADQLCAVLVAAGQRNLITNAGTGSPNVLLYNSC